MNQLPQEGHQPFTDYAIKKIKGQRPGESVSRSRRKLHEEIDRLRKFMPGVDKSTPRATIVGNITAQLQNARDRSPVRTIHALRFLATNEFLQFAIAARPGKLLSLPILWYKFTDIIRELKPALADELLSRPEHREAFIWQTAGLLAMIENLIVGDFKNIVVCEMKGNRKPPVGIKTTANGKRLFFFQRASGKLVPVPHDFDIDWPMLLFPGDRWRGSPIKDFSIGNAALHWPPRDATKFKHQLRIELAWEEVVVSPRRPKRS